MKLYRASRKSGETAYWLRGFLSDLLFCERIDADEDIRELVMQTIKAVGHNDPLYALAAQFSAWEQGAPHSSQNDRILTNALATVVTTGAQEGLHPRPNQVDILKSTATIGEYSPLVKAGVREQNDMAVAIMQKRLEGKH